MVLATSDVVSACADLQGVLSSARCCVYCSALFVITLSEEEPRDGDELFHLVLHGNREVWADKSMNLVRSCGACWRGNRARGQRSFAAVLCTTDCVQERSDGLSWGALRH